MGIRAFERVREKIRVDFYYNNEVYEGTVTDISHNGLHIDSEICPPFESDLEVVLILGDEVFRLPGKVKRVVNANEANSGMGVELSVPPQSYCKFISTVQDYY